ncbi:lysylphosphatidylglycerol synthase domain-containing protein [Acidiferrobacter sp.]|uniref:lysylphosphatidylglycerol synthase domain-containing protein n=1 Tax=Acidiferrobacter sp. TaxID=1872107 RepID=UPI002637B69B|nr:lysylphosphatidylglycerol synthase domain-containing protein [Acidiferrobacter sp.]
MSEVPRTSRARTWVRLMPVVAGALGFAGAVILFARNHPGRILDLVAFAGFGMLWLVPIRIVVLTLNAQGWRALFPKGHTVSLGLLTWLAFVRNAVNTLLPVAHVGGEVAAARYLIRRKVPAPVAVAGVVVETTITIFVQMGFALLGIGLLLSYMGDARLIERLWWGLAMAVPAGLVFVLLQYRSRLFTRLERGLARINTGLAVEAGGGAAVDEEIKSLYRRGRALIYCAFWQALSLLGGAGEFWVILHLLHQHASVRLAVLLESLVQAMQSAAFMVPGTLGVQEGGLIAIGAATGLPAEAALAISAVRRVRQIGISLPVLLLWLRAGRASSGEGAVRRDDMSAL